MYVRWTVDEASADRLMCGAYRNYRAHGRARLPWTAATPAKAPVIPVSGRGVVRVFLFLRYDLRCKQESA
jgi:hypothetical protein